MSEDLEQQLRDLDRMVRAIIAAHDSVWERRANAMAEHHRQAIAALSEAPREAEGWQLVPVEPTEEMRVVGLREGDALGELVDWRGPDTATRDDINRIWRAMLSAAPKREG